MSERAILRVRFTLASAPGVARKAVGGFLRYVQYRDKHEESRSAAPTRGEVAGMLKYVAHRDRSIARGRLFGPNGPAGDVERRELTSYVARSLRATAPVWGRDGKGQTFDRRRAVYSFVISPERAEGLDLERLTLAIVRQLEADLGGRVRWIAAEHRNTKHPHVHLVAAGIRELEDGTLGSWILSGSRLARAKYALALEVERQRGHHRDSGCSPDTAVGTPSPDRPTRPQASPGPSPANRGSVAAGRLGKGQGATPPDAGPRPPRPRRRLARRDRRQVLRSSHLGLHRLAARYRRDLARQAEEERRTRELERSR